MPTLKVKTLNSLADYIALVEKLRVKSDGPLWYRGCGNTAYELKPSLYRHPNPSTIEEFMSLEGELMARFQQRSIPFHQRVFSDSWDLLFFMQHFGIPTRLLDWSESPLMALFFAITSTSHRLDSVGKPSFRNDAAIWILDPVAWNKRSINLKSFEGKILATEDPNASSFKPIGDCKVMKDHPIAIFGAHNSQRIVAQRGVFVCFGRDTRPMEKIFQKDSFPAACLHKLVFAKEKLPDLYQAILRQGISDSVVFPDLDGLSREIKREFKFEV